MDSRTILIYKKNLGTYFLYRRSDNTKFRIRKNLALQISCTDINSSNIIHDYNSCLDEMMTLHLNEFNKYIIPS